VTDITYIDQNHRRSRVVIANNTVYVAGHTAEDRSQDAAGQTRQILAKIEQLLAEAGTSKEKLLSVTIWLASMKDFAAMNAIYDAWIVPGHQPARACGQVGLALPDILVEIIAMASL
jgi:enamine deaminase RidA (YjgF/YER057c/UK114 family)